MNTTTTTPDLALATVPPEKGTADDWHDGRYRLYTIEHLPFDALPPCTAGGPATVVTSGWSKSTSSLCRALSSPAAVALDDGLHTLRLSHLAPGADPRKAESWVRHELDGTRWATRWHAAEAAYNVGALAFMVYTKDAARWGLPMRSAA